MPSTTNQGWGAQPSGPQGTLASASFDWEKTAGPMQGPTSWTPSENSMASGQLARILQSDSPLMTLARSGAERAAARRGLLASSISAGAGQEAMISQATPIATQDAQTWANSQRDAAAAANDFARDANRFGRDRAVETYRGLLAREGRESDQAFQRDENATQRAFTTSEREAGQRFTSAENQAGRNFTAEENQRGRAFTTAEREAGQQFTAGENQRGREFTTAERLAGQTFTAAENQRGREFTTAERLAGQTFTSGENRANRDAATAERLAGQQFTSGENAATRAHNEAMTRLGSQLQADAQRANIPQQMMGNLQNTLSTMVSNILTDQNLDGVTKDANGMTAKDRAIQNAYNYVNSQMSWMSTFYGTSMPNFTGSGAYRPQNPNPSAGLPSTGGQPAQGAQTQAVPTGGTGPTQQPGAQAVTRPAVDSEASSQSGGSQGSNGGLLAGVGDMNLDAMSFRDRVSLR